MKKRDLLPILLLLAAVMGCSQLRDMAGQGNASNTTTSNPSGPADDAASGSSGVSPSGDPTADINRMADTFLAQKSFRAKMSGSGTTPVNVELEFVAPDRFRIKNAQGPEMIVVGKDVYIETKDRWQKVPGDLGASIPDMRKNWDREGRRWISDAKYVGEDTVNGKPANVYTYYNKGMEGAGANDSKIWISKADGLPLKIEANYKSGTLRSMTIEYDYDANISIEPPVK